jgi:hypothetical protein
LIREELIVLYFFSELHESSDQQPNSTMKDLMTIS